MSDDSHDQPPNDLPENLGPKDKSIAPAVSVGAAIAGGGCLAIGCGGIVLLGSIFTFFGDLMSGGQVPGHGQDEINSSMNNLGTSSGIMTFGLIALIGGIVYAVVKAANKKK